ncbi:hypothetical protein K8T06_01395 [bacterium]|nr:hypothetical protein [bacterium]
MSNANTAKIKQVVLGLEFTRLTHWHRYILNQNIARMEHELFPEQENVREVQEEEIWLGNKRKFYRLNVQKLKFTASIDLSGTHGIVLDEIIVLNLSSAGCCVLAPAEVGFKPGFRISQLHLPFPDEELVIRAKIIHISNTNSVKEQGDNCF